MHFFVINVWSIRILYVFLHKIITDNIICKTKYNIATITDYLEDLTGYKTRQLTHAKGEDNIGDKKIKYRL